MRIKVLTNHPIAVDSRDTTHPGGTMMDNSRNPAFNRKLFELYPPEKKLFICDLGCAGGGFVKDMVDAGHHAIGIEGSDYSLLKKRAEWATIPDNLFTADITKPFDIIDLDTAPKDWDDGSADVVKFDVFSAWEVMEHLPEEGIRELCYTVVNHLRPEGLWIMSVSTQVGEHHVTIKPRRWWEDLFRSHGLVNDPSLVRHFGDDWVRGPNQNAPESFHLILKRK